LIHLARPLLWTALLPLAGCAAAPVAPPAVRTAPPAAPLATTGLERVMGKDAAQLIALFGQPDADLREGDARKLQFAGPICVLDAYLYPPEGRGGAAVVTHIDTRQSDGSSIDRASCVAALARRDRAR